MIQALKIFLLVLVTGIIFCCCTEVSLNEKIYDCKDHEWKQKDKIWISFNIKDSGAYQPYLIVRHSQQFPYNKILVDVAVKDTANKTIDSSQVAVPLQDNTGHWTGNNIDDLYDHYTDMGKPLILHKGNYNFVLTQAMEQAVLPHVFNIGIGLKKTQ